MFTSQRVQQLPAYIFAELAEAIARLEQKGHRVINLGISDPDLPPDPDVVSTLCDAAQDPEAHRYPPYQGTPELRQAVKKWYWERFGVRLNRDTEIIIGAGSKSTLIQLALAVVDPDGLILVPDPAYPAYHMPHALYGFDERTVALDPDRDYLFPLNKVHAGDLERANLLYLNYPNNPTGAVAPKDFWGEVVTAARRWDFLVCSDLAYAEMVWNGRAHSILEIPEAMECAVESITFSKSYEMQGWRVSALVGNREAIAALFRVQSQLSAGVFIPVQRAAMTAISRGPSRQALESYRERRDLLGDGLSAMGFEVKPPDSALYYWVPAPGGDGTQYARWLLNEAHVAVTPGEAFGPGGKSHFRVSMTRPPGEIAQALVQWKEAAHSLSLH